MKLSLAMCAVWHWRSEEQSEEKHLQNKTDIMRMQVDFKLGEIHFVCFTSCSLAQFSYTIYSTATYP